jgi:hypothetical protein
MRRALLVVIALGVLYGYSFVLVAGREGSVCARGAYRAPSRGPSTSPLGGTQDVR